MKVIIKRILFTCNLELLDSRTKPVIISKKHFQQESSDDERVIQPMYWGLVPFWHKGELQEVNLSTNNARIETLTQKTMFSVPLKKGRRCVVLADGYYEWQKAGKATKQPYFIYFPQPRGIKIENHSWKDTKEVWSEDYGWRGPRLLTMAGVFDKWVDPRDSTEVYSYAVVTMDASPALSHIHERMPAILDGPKAVEKWLDFENVSTEKTICQWNTLGGDVVEQLIKGGDDTKGCGTQANVEKPRVKRLASTETKSVASQTALKQVSSKADLVMHPVSRVVGNSRNKSPECIQPIDLKVKDEPKGSILLKNWLKKESVCSPLPKEETDTDQKDLSLLKNIKREMSPSPPPNKRMAFT